MKSLENQLAAADDDQANVTQLKKQLQSAESRADGLEHRIKALHALASVVGAV